MKRTTLCFLARGDEVLIAMKKRGFGQGKWNGVGGKVESGETITEAAIRETEEEIGVKILAGDLKQQAILHFSFENKSEWNQECHVFVAKTWRGDPAESDEMKPQWFPFGKLPFENMWVDDPFWLPKVLSGKNIEAEFHFTADGKVILSKKILERVKFA